ncbi:MAG: tetratricopeptide repeat protein [Alphaproteobacteria bacterium]|nr:tetratricopeptide repeat protein [Alphaproteobacteria bacterium]
MSNDLSKVEQALNQGNAELALSLAANAIKGRPNWPRAHMLAASAAGQLGDFDRAKHHLGYCRTTLEQMPNNLNAHLTIANLYTAIGAFDGALEILEPLPARLGEHPDLLDALAINLHQAARFSEAVDYYKRMLDQEPGNINLYNNICAALLAGGDPQQAVIFADKWLALVPGSTEALSFRAVALEEGGETDAASELMNFERFVQADVVETPPGYDSMDAFNAALEQAVLSHQDLKTPPLDSPHYHDPDLKITDQILGPKEGPIADLEAVIRQRIEAYYANLGSPQDHAFVEARPQNYDLVAWAAVLDKQGNQDAHIHFDGHLSGCYYVRIPEEVSGEANGEDGTVAGGFEVGRPPPEFFCKREHRHKVVKPMEGMMVLFPSYMYHQTIPFKSTERRICVAFDAMPR